MNVIFLDIDGVLNNIASAADGVDLIPEKVVLLRHACQQTNASIVISSSWRKLYDLDIIRVLLYRAGIRTVPIIGRTPNSSSGHRGQEIKKFMDDWPGAITNYVILDDDTDILDEQLPHFIKIDNECGLLFADHDNIIKILTE